MSTQRSKTPWLPFGAAEQADIRLLCLPHSGAGASSYRAWGADLPDWIGLSPIQPPGRETRRQETPLSEVGPLVAALAEDVAAVVEKPYAVMGHSTGAICAFELCRQLRRIGASQPVHLFVAGRRAPQVGERPSRLEELTIEELAEILRHHGGTPEWVLNDPAMLRMLHPLLIADFAVSEAYRYTPEPPLDIPITAFAATDDPRATVAQLTAWEEQTTEKFTLHQLEGDHFAIFEHAPRVHAAIAEALHGG
ncbi:thioesterase II family protein [Streptantibioticus ferralitis]|uniref:Thioesterase domain-containing protein n=1 Tax=Streptantibioticus ferralitis TaxID=236510 RepID=A0ABT5YV87_9ACTN|nr:alpha/beta fold hydrolase [Streptantibioticus ferralitis]MDF2255506.1 thioesterase domain-containing protein [Streptantibioticus ferralitis]